MATTMTTPPTTTDETAQARADVIARLERLTRRVQQETAHATEAQFDAAYSEIVKLARTLFGEIF